MTIQEKIDKFNKIVKSLKEQISELQEMLKAENTDVIALMIVSFQKLTTIVTNEVKRLKHLQRQRKE